MSDPEIVALRKAEGLTELNRANAPGMRGIFWDWKAKFKDGTVVAFRSPKREWDENVVLAIEKRKAGEGVIQMSGETKPKLTGAAAAAAAAKAAREANAPAGQAGEAKAATPAKPKELHPCACGCGEMVARTFRMGHDSKYYSMLKAVARRKKQFSELPALIQQELKNVEGVTARLAESGH